MSTKSTITTLARLSRALHAHAPLEEVLAAFCEAEGWPSAVLWSLPRGAGAAIPVAGHPPNQRVRRLPSATAQAAFETPGLLLSSTDNPPFIVARRIEPSRRARVVLEGECATTPTESQLDVFELFTSLLCPVLDAMPTTTASGIERAVDCWRRLETGSVLALELRNALTVASVSLDLLADSPDVGVEDHRTAREALLATRRASELVKYLDAIEYAPPPSISTHDVAVLVRQISQALRAVFPPEIEIEVETPSQLPLVSVDAPCLQLALAELAFNARDAMPAGGLLRIEVDCLDHETLRVRISDSGPGLLPSQVESAFNLRYTTKRKALCRGLGLAAVRRVLSKMRGQVTLENTPAHGAVAEVRLPAAPQARP